MNKSFHINYLPKEKEMLVTYGSNKKLLKSIKNIKFTKIEIGLKQLIGIKILKIKNHYFSQMNLKKIIIFYPSFERGGLN